METNPPHKSKKTTIQQLSVNYHTAEDRLLLKIGMSNNYEVTAWLTRRVAKLLLILLNKTPLTTTPVPADYAARKPQIAQEMTKNAVSQKLDFSTQYQARKPAQPDKNFLVYKCQIEQNSTQNLCLELLCTNKQSIKLVLNDELLMALVNMLELSTRQADWDFSVPNAMLMPSPDNTKRVLH